MTADYRPTLALHCVWHPDSPDGPSIGDALFAHLFEDPDDLAAHGLRIPVRLWRTMDPRLDSAERWVVVVLVDDAFLAAGWHDRLEDLGGQLRGERDLLLMVSLSPHALDVAAEAAHSNFIRLHEVEDDTLRLRMLLNRVTHALCRLVTDTSRPVTVFLSHAKRDGEAIARTFRDFLQDGSGVEDFFDAQDIREGDLWAEVLRESAARNVLLAVRTDAYATREWCRTEVLEAKRGGAAVVVLDALDGHEARGFPYLGNAPAVRWRPGESRLALEELLGVVLKETLRFRYFPVRVREICRLHGVARPHTVMPAPPELITALRARDQADDGALLVYPDPPLGTDELEVVAEIAPALRPVTPTALVAGATVNAAEVTVGLSVSDPAPAELERHGASRAHVAHAFIELSRQILAGGGAIAYGGDMRAGGYTEILVNLIRTYSRRDRPDRERIRLYLARPVWETLGYGQRASLETHTTLVPCDGPDGDDPVSRAEGFTAMRRRMAEETDARVVLGGSTSQQSGRWPGIAEEAYHAVRCEQALFVLGGFGGAAERVADALRGTWPQELTSEFQLAHTETVATLVDATAGIREDELRDALENRELANGLDEKENHVLYETSDLDHMVALVLRGLWNR